MQDQCQKETDDILMWIVTYNYDTKFIELVSSATLFEFQSSVVYTFEMPEGSMENLIVKYNGRQLHDDDKTLLQLGVRPGDPLEVFLG